MDKSLYYFLFCLLALAGAADNQGDFPTHIEFKNDPADTGENQSNPGVIAILFKTVSLVPDEGSANSNSIVLESPKDQKLNLKARNADENIGDSEDSLTDEEKQLKVHNFKILYFCYI